MSPCSSANNEGRSDRGQQAGAGWGAGDDRRVRTWRGDEWSLTEAILDAVERQYGVVKYVSDFLGLNRAYIQDRISRSPWLRFGLDQAKEDETADSTRHYRAALSAGKFWAVSRHLTRQDRREREMNEQFVLELKLADRAAARNEARAAVASKATATRQTPMPSGAARDTQAADAPTRSTEGPITGTSASTVNDPAAPTLREVVANVTGAEARIAPTLCRFRTIHWDPPRQLSRRSRRSRRSFARTSSAGRSGGGTALNRASKPPRPKRVAHPSTRPVTPATCRRPSCKSWRRRDEPRKSKTVCATAGSARRVSHAEGMSLI